MFAVALTSYSLLLVALLNPTCGQVVPDAWMPANGLDVHRFASSCTIPIIEASDFSAQELDADIWERGPVLLRGFTTAQAAQEHWDRIAFEAKFGNLNGMRTVPLFSAQFAQLSSLQNKQSVMLGDYFSDMHAGNTGEANPPSLLFERSNIGLAAQALALHGVPNVMNHRLHSRGNDTMAIFSLGVHDQGLTFHQHAQTWLSVVRGRKLWFFMAPDALQNHKAYETLALKLPKEWPNHLLSDLEANKILVCEQLPGDVVHVPALWHHATQNDGDTLAVGMQSSDLDEASLDRYPLSAFVKNLRAQNMIVDLEDKKPINWQKKGSNALRAITNAISLEPLDFGRRSNAVLAHARMTRLEGKNTTDVVLSLFKEWSKVEKFANETYTRGLLSPPQFAAVMASIVQSIHKAVPPELQSVGTDVVDYLRKTGRNVDSSTFESFEEAQL